MFQTLLATILSFNIAATPHCTKGYRCGNTCISREKTCHVGQSASEPARTTRSTGARATRATPVTPWPPPTLFAPTERPHEVEMPVEEFTNHEHGASQTAPTLAPAIVCPPKTELCSDNVCVPTSEPCQDGAVRVVANGPRPLDDEVAPRFKSAPCYEPVSEFLARRGRRTVGFIVPGSISMLASTTIFAFTSSRVAQCSASQPCGDASDTRVARGGLISAIVFFVVGLGLVTAGVRSYTHMKRRVVGGSCTASGCGLMLRF